MGKMGTTKLYECKGDPQVNSPIYVAKVFMECMLCMGPDAEYKINYVGYWGSLLPRGMVETPTPQVLQEV